MRLADEFLKNQEPSPEQMALPADHLPEAETTGTYGCSGVRWRLASPKLPRGLSSRQDCPSFRGRLVCCGSALPKTKEGRALTGLVWGEFGRTPRINPDVGWDLSVSITEFVSMTRTARSSTVRWILEPKGILPRALPDCARGVQKLCHPECSAGSSTTGAESKDL